MRKRLLINALLVVALVGLGIATYANLGSSGASATTRATLATAKRAVVLSTVTATGNVEAPTDLSLSFQQSGKVASISVSVGDRVTAGQELARVEDRQQRASLSAAQASLASAQAAYAGKVRGETSYERASDATSVASASLSVTNAQAGLVAAQQTATTNKTKYQQQVDQAQASADSATANTVTAKSSLDTATSSLKTLQQSYDTSADANEGVDARVSRYKLDQVSCTTNAGTADYHPSDGVDCSQIANLIAFSTGVQTANNSYTQAQVSGTTATNALATAKQNQTAGLAQDQQAIDKAQQALDTAKAQYQSTLASTSVKQQPAKPEELAQTRASIASAQQQVLSAQKNADDTVLRAPADGTVASISGIVGQQSGSGGAASTSSSGTGASGASGASASTSSSSSSSGSGFIQLTDVASLDVKVGFTETDAGKVDVGQPATITLDAVPGKTYQGHVLTLDTNQTLVNNVVTYYAKISLEGSSGEVKPGMTASVSIVLDKRDNAVTLPTSAVPTSGTTATVTVRGTNGKDASRAITMGLRGDNAVEITNGLKVGDQVVVRSSTGGSTGGFQVPGGGGGLGGGGIPGAPG